MPSATELLQYGAGGVLLLCVLFVVFRGVPAFITAFVAWLNRLLEEQKAAYNAMLADSRENRETYQSESEHARNLFERREQALLMRLDEREKQIHDLIRGGGRKD